MHTKGESPSASQTTVTSSQHLESCGVGVLGDMRACCFPVASFFASTGDLTKHMWYLRSALDGRCGCSLLRRSMWSRRPKQTCQRSSSPLLCVVGRPRTRAWSPALRYLALCAYAQISIFYLYLYLLLLLPLCQGCIELLERMNIPIAGKKAAVIGRSNIVGMPAALLLQKRDATVTIIHSRTPDAMAICAGTFCFPSSKKYLQEQKCKILGSAGTRAGCSPRRANFFAPDAKLWSSTPNMLPHVPFNFCPHGSRGLLVYGMPSKVLQCPVERAIVQTAVVQKVVRTLLLMYKLPQRTLSFAGVACLQCVVCDFKCRAFRLSSDLCARPCTSNQSCALLIPIPLIRV